MRKSLLLTAIAVLGLSVVVLDPSVVRSGRGAHAQAQGPVAMALLQDVTGAEVGLATFTQEANRVLVRVTVRGLPPGFHGLHMHAVGSCAAPFSSAGSHFNPAGQTHPNHAGDFPVLLVNTDGTGESSFATDRFKLDELFDADGSALIIHATPDNYGNIPIDRYDPDPDTATLATGDSGTRLACGAMKRD